LLHLLHELVAVAGLFGEQLHDHQLQVSCIEETFPAAKSTLETSAATSAESRMPPAILERGFPAAAEPACKPATGVCALVMMGSEVASTATPIFFSFSKLFKHVISPE
jgi:hypothetical protein